MSCCDNVDFNTTSEVTPSIGSCTSNIFDLSGVANIENFTVNITSNCASGDTGGGDIEPDLPDPSDNYATEDYYEELVSATAYNPPASYSLSGILGLDDMQGDILENMTFCELNLPYASSRFNVLENKLDLYHELFDQTNENITFNGYNPDTTKVILNPVVNDDPSMIIVSNNIDNPFDPYRNDTHMIDINMENMKLGDIIEVLDGIIINTDDFKSEFNSFAIQGTVSFNKPFVEYSKVNDTSDELYSGKDLVANANLVDDANKFSFNYQITL